MENIYPLDPDNGGDGPAGGVIDKLWDRYLQRQHCETAAVATGVDFSHRVDDFVWFDGCEYSENQFATCRKPSGQGAEYPCCAIDCEFLLEPDFLQCTGLWLCIPVDYSSVGFDSMDDPCLLEGGQDGGIAANSLSSVGQFCGIPELWRMAAQLRAFLFLLSIL